MGGAPSAPSGPTAWVGVAGQYAQVSVEYWVHGPKKGEAFAKAGPRASYAEMSVGTGWSRQLIALLASVSFVYVPSALRPLRSPADATSCAPLPRSICARSLSTSANRSSE